MNSAHERVLARTRVYIYINARDQPGDHVHYDDHMTGNVVLSNQTPVTIVTVS